MNEFKKKPVLKMEDIATYEIQCNDDNIDGIQFVSLVSQPAIEIMGMMYSDQDVKKFMFKSIPDKQIICGPAMLPNKKILRQDEKGNYYNVLFTKDVINRLVDKFNKQDNNKSLNLNHEDKMVPGFIQENWIIESDTYDKSRYYGFKGLPVGTWFIVVKIEDENFWKNVVKGEGMYGFSIQGDLLVSPNPMNMNKVSIKDMEEFIDTLTEEEFKELMLADDSGLVHWNCKCRINDKDQWILHYEAEYPCEHCLKAKKQYEATGSFSTLYEAWEKKKSDKNKGKE